MDCAFNPTVKLCDYCQSCKMLINFTEKLYQSINTYVNNNGNWGAENSNTSFQQFTYSFTTGPSSTNTFKWRYYTEYYGYGIVDQIIVSWN